MSKTDEARNILDVVMEMLPELEDKAILAALLAVRTRMTRGQHDYSEIPEFVLQKLDVLILNTERADAKRVDHIPKTPKATRESIQGMFDYLEEHPPEKEEYANFIKDIKKDWNKGGISDRQHVKLWQVFYVRSTRIENVEAL